MKKLKVFVSRGVFVFTVMSDEFEDASMASLFAPNKRNVSTRGAADVEEEEAFLRERAKRREEKEKQNDDDDGDDDGDDGKKKKKKKKEVEVDVEKAKNSTKSHVCTAFIVLM